jgi:hypothetical protein
VLAQRSVQLDDGWKRVARIAPAGDGDTSATRFVWREAGADTFNRLLQSGDIAGPHWRIAFRHVQGPVEERAESWEVALSGDGKVVAVFHNLPEGRAGKKLAREEALALVQQFIAGNPALAGRPWELAVADQHERTARRDWVFRFDDKNALNVQGGFSRVSLNVRGDEVDAWRHVYVPDEWQRTQEAEQARKKPGKIISGLSIAGVLLIGVLVVLRRVGDGYRPMGLGLTGVALVFISSTTAYLLRFNERTLGFDPAQDWGSQVMTTIAMRTTFTLLLALLAAAMFMQYRGLVRVGAQRAVAQLLTGAALAMALQGAVSALYAALPVTDPALYDAGNSASVQPWLSTLAAGLMNAVLAVALVAVCAGVLAFCKTKVRTICVVAVLGIALLGTLLSADTLLAGIGQTVSLVLVAGLVVQLLKRSLGGIAVSFASVMSLDLPAKLLAVPVADAPLQAVLLVLTTTLATLACLRVFQGSAAGVAE